MAQKTKAVGNVQRAVPPFIFLSDVLQDYGASKVPMAGAGEDSQMPHGVSQQNFCDFGDFLAAKLESSEILLFDVHTLALISGLEMGEVVQYLRNRGSLEPADIGIANGRDYYLDGERAMQAISLSNVPTATPPTGIKKIPKLNADLLVAKRASGAIKGELVDDWGAEREQISVEFMQSKLAEARAAAKRQQKSPSILAARAARKPTRLLPAGAMAMLKKPNDYYDYFYSESKFNRSGLPALSLEDAMPKLPVSAQWLIDRTAEWQRLLNDMHLADGEKSHTQLCDELAYRLYAKRGLRETKVVTSSTIRRLTKPPGNTKPGGSKPKKSRK